MLYLRNNGATNILYINLIDRLPEGTDLSANPPTWSWLFNFTNEFTKESFTVIQILNKSAFFVGTNMVKMPLLVANTGTPNGLIQQIKLKDKGYYTYQIFLQKSITNLDIKNSVVERVVQTGKALTYDGTSEVEFKSQINGNPNNFIYVP